MKAICWFLLICITLACLSCEQWASETINQTEQNMASPVTAADYGGSLPVVSISCPDAGNLADAEDVRKVAATLLAIQDNLQNGIDDKVDRAGDTMTDKLTVNASTPNNDAIVATGNGSGFGVKGIGGATGGGGRFVGTGNGSMGVSAVGGPSAGTGIVGTGGIGGLAAELYPGTSPTATVPQMNTYLEGYLCIAGVQPNPTTDPGADNALHGANIPKTWARIASRSGDTDSTRVKGGYNIASVTTTATSCTVAFVRPITADYAVEISIMGGAPYAIFRTVSETSTGFIITGHYMPSDLDVAIQTAGQFDIGLVVHGRQ